MAEFLQSSLRSRILAEVVGVAGRGPSEFEWICASRRDSLYHHDSGFYISVADDGMFWTPRANRDAHGSAGSGEEPKTLKCARAWADALRRELERMAFLHRIDGD